MSKQQEMDARLQNALTVIQSVTPPSLPADAEVMTIVIEWPPGDPGALPHRHPGGPSFGYVLFVQARTSVRSGRPRRMSTPDKYTDQSACHIRR